MQPTPRPFPATVTVTDTTSNIRWSCWPSSRRICEVALHIETCPHRDDHPIEMIRHELVSQMDCYGEIDKSRDQTLQFEGGVAWRLEGKTAANSCCMREDGIFRMAGVMTG